jgi:hypothetical protein
MKPTNLNKLEPRASFDGMLHTSRHTETHIRFKPVFFIPHFRPPLTLHDKEPFPVIVNRRLRIVGRGKE